MELASNGFRHVEKALRVLLAVCHDGQFHRPLLTIAMGEAGQRSRLEGWKFGSVATFASAGTTTAPGQPTIAQLRTALGRD